jgi:transcription elongation factor Spt5
VSETEVKESKGHLTTIFAVRTTIGREKSVQELVFNRLRTINPVPDLKAILTSEQYRGYVFIEAIHQRDVIHVTNGVPHVKGRVVGSIPFDNIEGIIKPERIISTLDDGDIVELLTPTFAGKRALITKMSKSGKEKITVRLMDSESSIVLEVAPDMLKLLEKGKRTATQYIISQRSVAGPEGSEEEGETAPEFEGLDDLDKIEGIDETVPEIVEDVPKAKRTRKSKAEATEGEEVTIETPKEKVKEKEKKPARVIIHEEKVAPSLDDTFSFSDDTDEEEAEAADSGVKSKASKATEVDDEEEEEEEDDWAKFMN